MEGYARECMATLQQPEEVIERVAESTRRSETSMILATCGYMLSHIVRTLKAEGIPFWNPYRIKNGEWNPLRRSNRDNTAYKKIQSFLKYSKDYMPWTWMELSSWAGALGKDCIKHGFKSKLKANKAMKSVVEYEKLFDILEPGVLKIAMEGDLDAYLRLLPEKERNKMTYPVSVMSQFSLEDIDRPKVIVGTVHSVKGGEADHVYLFPDLSRAAQHERVYNEDSIFRTFYVGLTRAKIGVNLCRPSCRNFMEWL
jgi:superfamily I DNA/RNA helicase